MTDGTAGVSAYRFGAFELRPRDFTLARYGVALKLSPKAFDMLRILVERHGEVVGKRELIAALWPDTFVEESNLTVHVSAIRKALNVEGAPEQFIENVPKRGYRFFAPVTVVQVDSATANGQQEPEELPVSIAVVPLRILRGHSDIDFLAFSLPDAIAASLAERTGLQVRSPLAAADHGGADASLSALGTALRVKFALTGTLAHRDGKAAMNLRLLSVPAGVVLWADSCNVTTADLFSVQDGIATRVAEALAETVGSPSVIGSADRDVPKGTGAYAFYLRANQLAYEVRNWPEARDLYRASLEADPGFAPAWARLGRCERLIGKYASSVDAATEGLARADEAFQRALSLNPDLAIAHSLHAQLMIDTGRADEAMRRLVERVQQSPTDPELYAGLVHALRYCGLLDASIAAHRKARRLDPTIPTSVHHTWWMAGDYERALAETLGDIGYMQGLALASLGRDREAIAALRWRERETTEGRIRPYLRSLRVLLEGDSAQSRTAAEAAVATLVDPEAIYYMARTLARVGASERAVHELDRVVRGGFWCHEVFVRDAWLAPIRERPDVQAILEHARSQMERAKAWFVRAGGLR
jgi:DNA-binding winged helix-turn-helix (wHTH) protein/tetratricopeptide (TPR) repeat protein